MKSGKLIFVFFVCAFLWGVTGVESSAQYSMDRDFAALRNNLAPDFSYHYDDYIQYSPAVLTLGIKACGYKGQSDWGRMLVADAFSVAVMAGVTNALKYSVKRERPDGSARNSFPSGHTATAFMCATMLHKEYGWRNIGWSIGGYSVAMLTALSRNLNNKHWVSDTFMGAAIGVGSVELGYYLTGLIFKEKHLWEGYESVEFNYGEKEKGYYTLGPMYSRRFIIGSRDLKESSLLPFRGSTLALNGEFPLMKRAGLAARLSAGSLLFKDDTSFNEYGIQAGMFWEYEFAKVLEMEASGLIGYAGHKIGGGIDITASASLNLITGNHCKLKALAEWETFSFAGKKYPSYPNYLNSVQLGFAAVLYW